MSKEFDLEQYLVQGVENVVKGAVKATLKDPKESKFMASFALASRKAAARRAQFAALGEHIPPFLIASITSSCNLHCAGCYARENHACSDEVAFRQLTDDQWLKIFQEATEMGISFILLAGGEPFLRKDVIKAAGNVKDIMFPIFTNGTMLDEDYLEIFKANRNLVPIFSIEGDEANTDSRRGEGTYNNLIKAMDRISSNRLIFGASVTVTTKNKESVTSQDFLEELNKRGCKAVIYVEYVPVIEESKELAFGDDDRIWLAEKLDDVRKEFSEMVFVSFPGDEKSSGGCLAAGRGFFHINSHGGAEPCPFSPYSDINVADSSLRDALKSKLFTALHDGELLLDDHRGGCVLFEKKEQVEKLLKENTV